MKAAGFTICLLFLTGILSAQDTVPRNSVIIESNFLAMSSISYNRMFKVNERPVLFGGGYIMGTGFGYGSHWLKAESSILFFGPRHSLETGVLFIFGINDDSSPGIKTAYRFQAKKGLTITAGIYTLFNTDPPVMPAIGLGYSF